MSGRRPQRLAEGIREEVAQLIGRELKDPRLGFLTVTRVELSSDLAHARVFVGVLGGETERRRSLEALQHAAGFVRREIGRRLRLRVVPEIVFRYDEGLEATDRVARLLQQEHVAEPRGSAEAAPEGAPGVSAGSPGEDEEGRE